MKFLIDEDIPVKLLKELIAQGHDAVRVTPGSADIDIAQIRIHPPFAPVIISAFKKLLQSIPPEKFKGLLILLESGNIRVSE